MRTHEKLLELSPLNRRDREKVVQLLSVDYRAYGRKRFLAGDKVEAMTFLRKACRLSPSCRNILYWCLAHVPGVSTRLFWSMDDQRRTECPNEPEGQLAESG